MKKNLNVMLLIGMFFLLTMFSINYATSSTIPMNDTRVTITHYSVSSTYGSGCSPTYYINIQYHRMYSWYGVAMGTDSDYGNQGSTRFSFFNGWETSPYFTSYSPTAPANSGQVRMSVSVRYYAGVILGSCYGETWADSGYSNVLNPGSSSFSVSLGGKTFSVYYTLQTL